MEIVVLTVLLAALLWWTYWRERVFKQRITQQAAQWASALVAQANAATEEKRGLLADQAAADEFRQRSYEEVAARAERASERLRVALGGHSWRIGGRHEVHGREPRIKYECPCGACVFAGETFFSTESVLVAPDPSMAVLTGVEAPLA